MKNATLLALACLASTVAVAGPFDQVRGKMKPGMYEYKTEMDMGQMPGMPPGMGKQSHTFQRCVTQEQIDKGEMSKGPRDQQGDCQIKNMNVSGNTASYNMECPNMKGEAKMTFAGDGFKMDSTMAMNQGGRQMNMKQHMEAKYLGPCK